MNIVIPMAGRGTRMRPHTLNTPKPLIKIAGKTIVERLVEEIANVVDNDIDNIGFIIGDFGKEVENSLLNISQKFGAKGHIFYQEEALGTAHAVDCASEIIKGPVIVAFADTLFDADFNISNDTDAVIWVNKVKDPTQFGVVVCQENIVKNFVEKPKEFISDLAIIGIYYFKDGDKFNTYNKKLIQENRTVKGEYQLTDVLEDLKNDGVKFKPGTVKKWMDCGNVNATLETNKEILSLKTQTEELIDKTIVLENTIIIEPCYIAGNCKLTNSVIGPNVSVNENTELNNVVLNNSIIGSDSKLKNIVLNNSFVGSKAIVDSKMKNIDISDYSKICL